MEKNLTSQLCSIHSSIIYKCYESACLNTDICRDCIFQSKEEILHYYNDFDHIKPLQATLNTELQIKQDECYSDINEEYIEISTKIHDALDKTFSELDKRKENIKLMMIKPVHSQYEKLTSSFEKLIKELKQMVNDLSLSSNSSKNKIILELKKGLDEYLVLLGNKEEIRARFEKYFQQSETLLRKLTVREIIKLDSNKIQRNFSDADTLVQVFGNGLGRVEPSSEQTLNPAKIILNKSDKGDHWNSDKLDIAHLNLYLVENSIIKQIIIGVRCCQIITVQGFEENGNLIELLARRQTNLSDDATYTPQRILNLNFEKNIAVNKVTIICEKGANISLFWVEVFGYVLNGN